MLVSFLSFKSHFWDDKNIIVQMSPFIPVRPHITKEMKMKNYILNIWYISETLTSCCQNRLNPLSSLSSARRSNECVFNRVLVGVCIDCGGGISSLVINSLSREA